MMSSKTHLAAAVVQSNWKLGHQGDRLLVPIFAGLVVASFFAPAWLLSNGAVTLARALAVLGLILMLRAGLVSFGQGLYFCLGGYSVGMLDLVGVSDLVLRVLGAGALCFVVALPVGFLLRRYRGLFFAMLSLAFSMLLFGLLVRSQTFGSTDGFNVVPTTLFGASLAGQQLQRVIFIAAATTGLICCLLTSRYFDTVVGRIAPALKDNEVRIEYLGHSGLALIHFEYTIAAIMTGFGGAIVAMAIGHIDPEMAYWTTSGDIVFIAILGGHTHVLAAFLGSVVFELVHTVALWLTPGTWRLILGAVLLLLILKLPEGLWSLFRRRA